VTYLFYRFYKRLPGGIGGSSLSSSLANARLSLIIARGIGIAGVFPSFEGLETCL